LTFDAFKGLVNISNEDIWRDFYRQNKDKIKVKKEDVAVRNLVKISSAALSISNRKGFSLMTLRDLSVESGLSMGALYSYFSSKDELLDMIQQQRMTAIIKVFSTHLSGIDNPAQRLRSAIQIHLYLSEVMQPWFYFSYMEAKNLGKDDRKKAIEAEIFTEGIFIDIIEQGQKKSLFRNVDPKTTAAIIKAMLQDWYLKRWKYESRNVSVEEYSEVVIDFVESYLMARNNQTQEEKGWT